MSVVCVLTRAAERDLEEIGDFIAQDSPKRALAFVADLRSRCRHIVEFPEAAPLRPDLGESVRMLVHAGYLILYSQRDDAIIVERIVHGARYIPALN